MGGLGFDWIVVVLSAWFIGGVYLDGWAHLHVPELETFFTPWHTVLYSGFLTLAGVLVGSVIRNRAMGRPWTNALSIGYELSLLGVLIFAAAAIGDMLWHLAFGIEKDLEALFSPTHLALALGGSLIVTGPLRAAWRRSDAEGDPRRWTTQLPAILSMIYLLSVITFFTQYAHPFGRTWPAQAHRPDLVVLHLPGLTTSRAEMYEILAVASILLQTAVLMGLLLLALRRWPLRPGSLTLLLVINTSLMVFMRDTMVPPGPRVVILIALLGGIAADLLLWLLRPSIARQGALRLFAFGVPVLLYIVYFLTLMVLGGIWWSLPMWTGSIALAGLVGLLLSYLVAPLKSSHSESGR